MRTAKTQARKGLRIVFFRDDGSVATSFVILLLCLALWIAGQRNWSLLALFIAILLALQEATQNIQEQDKQSIRFNVMDASDVLKEMMEREVQLLRSQIRQTSSTKETVEKSVEIDDNYQQKAKLVIGVGLQALAKKYGKSRNDTSQHDDELALLCQQASYIGFRMFPQDDAIISSSLALLALVAKNECVQERHLRMTSLSSDDYSLKIPIQCMKDALERAKSISDPSSEQCSAELLRKGFLLLGAVSSSTDGTSKVASMLVQQGGLEVILHTIDWYRYHSDVVNWGLWAIFTMCYENYFNKIVLVQHNGIPLVVQTMQNCADCLEVARHGTAILFDLLRNDDENDNEGPPPPSQEGRRLDVWKLRTVAVEAGLHKSVVQVMDNFPQEMSIMMMGQEILVGTNYQGNIPQFQPIE